MMDKEMLNGGIRRPWRNLRTLAYIILDLDSADIEYMALATIQEKSITDISHISQPAAGSECCICLQDEGGVHEFECGHHMHEECSLKWFEQSNTCPTCRHMFELS